MLEAIILAGSPKKRKHLIRGKHKFFTMVNNNYLGNLVVDALTKSRVIESIYIIENKPELEKIVTDLKVRQIIQEKGGIYSNAIIAFNYTKNSDSPDKQVLYSAWDLLFLNPIAIENFISNTI